MTKKENPSKHRIGEVEVRNGGSIVNQRRSKCRTDDNAGLQKGAKKLEAHVKYKYSISTLGSVERRGQSGWISVDSHKMR